MPFDELIEMLKLRYEAETGWGDSSNWTNQDFINLSELIHERTGVTLSHVTLKRIWGRVKYESLPNTFTLDTLSNFIGFASWRKFVTEQNNHDADVLVHEPVIYHNGETLPPPPPQVHKPARKAWWLPLSVLILAIGVLVTYFSMKKSPAPVVANANYKFSSRTVVTSGLPNSVIFTYDATKAPGDSVIIQQSWDRTLRTKVSKYDHQHTSIYYYPDYYKAKLIVNNRIVKQHELLIKSDGWLTVVTQNPVPVYFKKEDVMKNGLMELPVQAITSHNIKMQPDPPYMLFSNVKDFGEIYSDDFVFETSLKNTYREGAGICQNTTLYLLCKGTAIGIPLCSKGCVSAVDLLFTDFFRSGKKHDLSAFGVDFNDFIKLRIVSHNKKAQIFINDKLTYTVNSNIVHSKIIGIDYRFQGTGAVNYVKMYNSKVRYEDEF